MAAIGHFSQAALLGAKLERTPGTAEALTSSETANIVLDLQPVTIDDTKVVRPRSDTWGVHASKIGLTTGGVRFSMELSHADANPAWLELFLLCCGFKESTNTYVAARELASNASAGVKSCTLGYYLDGTAVVLYGCAGNATFRFEAGQIMRVDFEFWGKILPTALMTDVALPTPASFSDPDLLYWRHSADALVFGAYTPKASTLTLSLNNTVAPRLDANAADASGIHHFYVANRAISGEFDPELDLVATKDILGEWKDGTTSTFSLLGYTADGTTGSLEISSAGVEWRAPRIGARNGLAVWQLGFGLLADDLTFTPTSIGATPTPSPTPTPPPP